MLGQIREGIKICKTNIFFKFSGPLVNCALSTLLSILDLVHTLRSPWFNLFSSYQIATSFITNHYFDTHKILVMSLIDRNSGIFPIRVEPNKKLINSLMEQIRN